MANGEVGRERGAEVDHLALRLGDLARYLQEQDTVEDTLQGIVDTAVQTVPGAEHAGLSVVEEHKAMSTVAFSDDLVCRVDKAQVDFEQGPCVDALYEERVVRVLDTTRERRWPRFAAHAAELGVRSMLSFQLYVTGDGLGALNLYAERADAFTEESEQVGWLFATHAAVAMADAQKLAHLTRAVSTRDLIGQAKGILMERHKITGDRAFALLVRASQHSNTRLVEVAEHLVRSGSLVKR